MKRAFLSLFAPFALGLPAHAQFGAELVYDPANHAENIITAAQMVRQIENQIRQLAHEIEMLENMARNLETLDVDLAQRLIRNRIARIEELMRRAEDVGHGVEEVERDYEEIYPEDYGETPPGHDVLVEEARARWRASRTAYKHTLLVSAAALEDNETDADSIAALVTESQTAIGNLQAVQAGNQIEALQAQQLIQVEAILAAHYRAEAMERARVLAEETRARARMKSFFGN